MRLWGMVAAVKWVLCAQARPSTLTFGELLLEKNMPPQGVAKVALQFLSWVGRSPQREVI
jgi:hypothetical protein